MATNMYLKFEEPELKSGSTASEHKDEIEILSWNHGFSQPTSSTRSTPGSTTEQSNHQNLSFSKYLDGSTAELMKYHWAGKQFGKATITCFRADGSSDNKPVKYLEILMTHVVVANISMSGGPGDIPVENVSLDYGTIQYTTIEQKQADGTGGGNKPAKHDLEQRKIA